MQDGIYHVRLSSSAGKSSEGLVVISQGSVNGGDLGFLYLGYLSGNDAALSGKLAIKRWSPNRDSVFEALDDFELVLSGRTTEGNAFSVSGGVSSHPGMTIAVTGRYLSAVDSRAAA